jgi:hypothetical protein
VATKRGTLEENRIAPAAARSVIAPQGTQASNPTTPLAINPASQDASKPDAPQEKMIGKSYRFPLSHARRFAAWTAERGLTEQEATRLAQIMFMEQYENGG